MKARNLSYFDVRTHTQRQMLFALYMTDVKNNLVMKQGPNYADTFVSAGFFARVLGLTMQTYQYRLINELRSDGWLLMRYITHQRHYCLSRAGKDAMHELHNELIPYQDYMPRLVMPEDGGR